jgi:hypothetical protein
MNSHIAQRYARTSSFILGAGIVGLLLGPMAGAISLSHAASPAPPVKSHSDINRTLPGAKTGMLKMMTDTTAQIDNATYPLAPRSVIETETGSSLSRKPGWQKRLAYPISVQYWLEKPGITQMLLYSNGR